MDALFFYTTKFFKFTSFIKHINKSGVKKFT